MDVTSTNVSSIQGGGAPRRSAEYLTAGIVIGRTSAGFMAEVQP